MHTRHVHETCKQDINSRHENYTVQYLKKKKKYRSGDSPGTCGIKIYNYVSPSFACAMVDDWGEKQWWRQDSIYLFSYVFSVEFRRRTVGCGERHHVHESNMHFPPNTWLFYPGCNVWSVYRISLKPSPVLISSSQFFPGTLCVCVDQSISADVNTSCTKCPESHNGLEI